MTSKDAANLIAATMLGIASTLFYTALQIIIKTWIARLNNINSLASKVNLSVFYLLIILVLGSCGFLLWFIALQRASITQIYWTTALSYIIVPTMAFILFKERISLTAMIGYLLITVGGILASHAK